MKKKLLALLLALVTAVPASAQISIPNTFVANTRIVSADVNANFTELGTKALNRTGGTMTGDLVISTVAKPDVDGGADLGTALLRFGTFYVENVDVDAGLVVDTLTVADVTAASIDTAGGITAGSGSVVIVGADGRIPAISSTEFASLSGAQLTGILETGIADGALLARVGSAETITAQWTFTPSGGATLWDASSATSNAFAIRGRASDEQGRILFLSNTGATNHGVLQADTDTISILTGNALGTSATFSPTTINLTASGNLNFAGSGITNGGTYHTGTTQPGFFVTRTSGTPVTGAVNSDTVTWESEVYDTGGNFAAGVFTAPVTGTYEFCFNGSALTSGSTAAGFKLVVNGVSYVMENDHAAANNYTQTGSCVTLPLTAAQTATAQVYENGSETIEYGYTARDIWFSGRLVP